MLTPIFTLAPLVTLESARTALAGVFFVYLALLLGERLLHTLRTAFVERVERAAYAITIGYGVWGLIGFALAVLGMFTQKALWGVAVLLLLTSFKTIRAHATLLKTLLAHNGPAPLKNYFLSTTGLKLLICLWLVLNATLIFVPLTGHDTLDYHFPIIESVAQNDGLDFGLTRTPIPFFGEIIYAVPTALFRETSTRLDGPGEKTAIKGPFAFQLVQWSTMPLLVIILYGAARQCLRQSFLPFMLVLLVLALMDLWREVFHGGYIDMLAYLFGTTSALLLFRQTTTLRKKTFSAGYLPAAEAALAGILLGFALATKYHGLFFAVAASGVLLANLAQWKPPLRTARRLLLLFVCPALIVSSFWYLKNTLAYSNPVYPMFSDAKATDNVSNFLTERTVKNFVAFPYIRYAGWFTSENESSSRLVTFGYFLLFALLVPLTLILRRARWSRTTVLAVFLFLALYMMTFLTSHQHRFLLPSQVFLAYALVFLIDELYSYLAVRHYRLYQQTRRCALVILPVLFFFVFLGNIHYFYVRWQYMLGILDTQGYIADIGSQ